MSRKPRAINGSVRDTLVYFCTPEAIMELMAKVSRCEPLTAEETNMLRAELTSLEANRQAMDQIRRLINRMASAMHRSREHPVVLLEVVADIIEEVMDRRDKEAAQNAKDMLEHVYGQTFKRTGAMWSGTKYIVRLPDET